MSCERSELWMMEALDSVLSAPDRLRLDEHLQTCSRCRVEWDALNAIERVLSNPPLAQPAPGFPARVQARLERFETQRRTLLGGLILMAAAMALCLMALPALLNGRNPLAAYGAFLRNTYELLGYGLLLSYRLFSALWLTLNQLSDSAGLPLMNLLTYAAGAVLLATAWRRSLASQREATQMLRNGH